MWQRRRWPLHKYTIMARTSSNPQLYFEDFDEPELELELVSDAGGTYFGHTVF